MRVVFIALLLLSSFVLAQNTPTLGQLPDSGPALPATCSLPQIYFKTTATVGLYACTSPNTWVQIGGGAGSGTVTNTGNLTLNSLVIGNGSADTKVLPGFTTDGVDQLNIGAAGTGSGVLGLVGTTSGTATIAGPAVAGTATNPIVISNALSSPAGTGANPTYSFTGQLGSGLFNVSATTSGFANNSTSTGLGLYNASTQVSLWSRGTSPATFIRLGASETNSSQILNSGLTTSTTLPAFALGGTTGGTALSLTATSGTQYGLAVGWANASQTQMTFAPTSGTANFVGMIINPAINQTGTSSGSYTALLVNPTETALLGTSNLLADFATGGTSRASINNKGVLKDAATISTGTTFTSNNGCTETSLAGGSTAGKYVSGTTGTCTVVITMGNSATAPNGWACFANDLTTVADTQKQSATTTTTATITGTTVSGDVINFACIGY